ncbi:hypothetical protein [Acidithiobacillus sp. AMEEHan]|uniref:hypothetical protein n=1 Tax=Acidithiobacillus sp. AMEEHan TaxID=2994951 RepID=UPI0027E54F76|nr:hypothetical protein [Acidithiobacillus sp. AMEEHan]
MPMVNILAYLEVLIALLILVFLVVTFFYLIAPQGLDAFLRRVGVHRGIGALNARNVFAALRQLGILLFVLGVITLAMILFRAWPRGWLIPAIQELVMAVVLFFVGHLGAKGQASK